MNLETITASKYAEPVVIGVLALLTLMYTYKSVKDGGVDTGPSTATFKRNIFQWVDIAIALIAAYFLLKAGKSLL